VYLASIYARSTSQAFVRINDCKVVGLGDGVLNAEVIDSTKYAAAATAAIADIANPLDHVAHGMNEPNLLELVEGGQRFFSGNINGTLWSFKRCEEEATSRRKVTVMTKMILLHPTNAIAETECFGGQEDLADVIIGKDPFRFHSPLCWENTVESRLWFHDTDRSTVHEIVLDEMC
jgi:hypothetical protein